jgi:WD40 repeat protein
MLADGEEDSGVAGRECGECGKRKHGEMGPSSTGRYSTIDKDIYEFAAMQNDAQQQQQQQDYMNGMLVVTMSSGSYSYAIYYAETCECMLKVRNQRRVEGLMIDPTLSKLAVITLSKGSSSTISSYTCELWSLKDSTLIATIDECDGYCPIMFSNGIGKYIASSNTTRDCLAIWDLQPDPSLLGEELQCATTIEIDRTQFYIRCFSFTSDNDCVVVGLLTYAVRNEGTLCTVAMYSVCEGTKIMEFPTSLKLCAVVSNSNPSNCLFAAVEENQTVVWSCATRTKKLVLKKSYSKITGPDTVIFAPNDNLWTADREEESLSCWDVPSGTRLRTISLLAAGLREVVMQLIYQPTGNAIIVVMRGSKKVYVLDADSGQLVCAKGPYPCAVCGVFYDQSNLVLFL